MPEQDERRHCEIIEVDGQPVRVQLGAALTDDDRAALAEVVRAAHRKLATMPPGPLSVDCPVCKSEPGTLCRRPTGVGRSPHPERRLAAGGSDA